MSHAFDVVTTAAALTVNHLQPFNTWRRLVLMYGLLDRFSGNTFRRQTQRNTQYVRSVQTLGRNARVFVKVNVCVKIYHYVGGDVNANMENESTPTSCILVPIDIMSTKTPTLCVNTA